MMNFRWRTSPGAFLRPFLLAPEPARTGQRLEGLRAEADSDCFDVTGMVRSLLPPGWICCTGCHQPVNATWNKCPKVSSPNPSPPAPLCSTLCPAFQLFSATAIPL